MRVSKGQNIIECILLVAAVIIVCVIFLKPHAGSPMYDGVNASLNGMITQINTATATVTSHLIN